METTSLPKGVEVRFAYVLPLGPTSVWDRLGLFCLVLLIVDLVYNGLQPMGLI